MAGCEFAVLVAEKGCFGGQYGRAGVKRKLLVYGNGKFLRTAKKCLCKRKAFVRKKAAKETFLFCGKGFFDSCKGNRYKEKPFFSAPKSQFPTAPKLTCNNPFRIAPATVSLQYNIPFSKPRSLALALRRPFRTDSNPHRRYPETLRFPTRSVT